MLHQEKNLSRYMSNTAQISNLLSTVDLKQYFDKNNKQAKHAHDKDCLVPLSIGGVEILLTEREAHCALLTTFGYTSKEIAVYMLLSPRTIEHYLSCIKKKLYITKRSELIIALFQSDFIKVMDKLIKKRTKKRK